MDRIIRGIDKEGFFRFHLAETTQTVEYARKVHDASPTATAAMGRLLTMAEILSLGVENEDESLTLQIRGTGPGGVLIAVTQKSGEARVSATNPKADVASREDGHLDVGAWVGKEGTLTVTRGYKLKEPFSGTVPLVSGEIAEDFASYFFHSEQTPTVVSLGVLVDTDRSVRKAGGIFVQVLPDVTEDALGKMEEAVAKLDSVTTMLDSGLSLEDILAKYFSDFSVSILDELEPKYVCDCSRKKMARALASLPTADRKELAEEDDGAEVICEFCNTAYHFSAEELLADGRDETL